MAKENDVVGKNEIRKSLESFLDQSRGRRSIFNIGFFKKAPEKINVSDFLLKKYGKRDLSGIDLRGLDFSHTNLQYVVFDQCNLEGVSFEGASLFGASLKLLVSARSASFKKSNLVMADFSSSCIVDADFSVAIAHFASFYQCKMRACRFSNADCTYANFQSTHLESLTLKGADLSSADFRNCHIVSHSSLKLTSEIFSSIALVNHDYLTAVSFGIVPIVGYPEVPKRSLEFQDNDYVNTPSVDFNEAAIVSGLQLSDCTEFLHQKQLIKKGATFSSSEDLSAQKRLV